MTEDLLTGGTDPAPSKKKQPFQFVPPDFNAFAAQTGFGYGSLYDQLKDAFSTPGRGAGQFNGNKLARYATPAPQVTVDPYYNTLQQYIKPQNLQSLMGLLGNMGGGIQPTQPTGTRGGRGLL